MQKIPAWESIILTNDFGDEYWVSGIQIKCKEAFNKIQNIRKSYRNIHQWIEACEIYDEYIRQIIDYHGGMEIIQACLDAGETPEGWKPRPKLKMTKQNKEIVKTGIIPSKVAKMTDEDWEEAYEIMTSRVSTEDVEDLKCNIKPAKGKHKKILGTVARAHIDKTKAKSMSLTRRDYASDIISEYYNSVGDRDTTYSDEGYEDKSLKELAAMFEEENKVQEWEPVYDEWSKYPEKLRFDHNRMLSNKQCAMVDVMKTLHESGLNILDKSHLKLMDKAEARLYSREIGQSMLSEKERKKSAKKYKKYQKEREKTLQSRADSDRALSRLLTGNKGSANVSEDFTIEELQRGFKKY